MKEKTAVGMPRRKGRQRVAALSVQEKTEETMDGRRVSEGACRLRVMAKGRKAGGINRAGSPGRDMATPFIKGPGTLPRRTA